MLDSERVGKYRKYNQDLEVNVTSIQKCDYPFKLHGEPVANGGCCILKVICRSHNHELIDTLVSHSSGEKLKPNEHFIVLDMTKSLVKSTNILFTLKENNENNVTTIKQVYNVR